MHFHDMGTYSWNRVSYSPEVLGNTYYQDVRTVMALGVINGFKSTSPVVWKTMEFFLVNVYFNCILSLSIITFEVSWCILIDIVLV